MLTELGRSQVEVTELGRGPAVLTELGRSQVEVQQCPLRAENGEELGKDLARRK